MKQQVQRKTSTILLGMLCALTSLQATPLLANFYQKVDIVAKNKTLKSILQDLEKQSGFYFLYDNDIVSKHKNLNIDFSNMELKEALGKLSETIGVSYRIVDKTVTLYYTQASKVQSEIRLSGIVRLGDKDSDILRTTNGISIQVKGTNRGTTTNFKGEFSLNVPANSTIVVSYMGYAPKEISNLQSTFIDITLEESERTIDEVIVSAYGTKESKENQIGSAYTVTAKDLEKRPALRIDALLQGIVPGVEYSNQEAGNAARPRFRTRVRGEASAPYGVSSNDPLWVVDGIPLNTGGQTNQVSGVETSISPLTYLNPNDIESLVVLKDANATAIYGASGSNGVILITTKKGKGRPNIDYSVRTGIEQMTNRRFQVLNGDQYRRIIDEMGLNSQISVYGNTDTDWYNVYFRTGNVTLHNLSVSGGNEDSDFRVSAGIYDQKLTSIANTTDRYSIRSNFNTKIGSRIGFNLILGGSYNLNDMYGFNENYYERLPVISPYNSDGSFALFDAKGNGIRNALAEAYQNDNKQKNFYSTISSAFTVKIWNGLEFVSRNGFDFHSLNEKRYSSMQNLSGRGDNGYLYKNQVQNLNWVSTNTFNYSKSIYDGTLTALLGMEANKAKSDYVGASAYNFPNDYLREINLAPSDNRRSTGSSSEESSLSYLGRAAYLWKNKYNVNFNFRKEGDSDFGEDVKWATFYAFGGAWTISNEDFWRFEPINFLKIKATYGTAGNGRFQGNYARGVYQISDSYTYGNNLGATMSRGRNKGLTWETTYMFNTGIDFSLFNRINVAAEFYNNVTHDLINDSQVSLTSGQRELYQNSGKIQNKGFEVDIKSENLRLETIQWHTRFNLSLNRNKILEMPYGADRSYTDAIMREGYDSRAIYLVRWAGVDPSTGDPMWYDANGNITKAYNVDNRVLIGSPNPDFYGGMTNILNYKNFNLSFLFLYTKGGLANANQRSRIENDALNILSTNSSINILDHWQYPGDLSVGPRLSQVTTSSGRNSTRFLHSRSSIELKNISLEYSLEPEFLRSIFLKSASVYAQLDNIGIWNPYKTKKTIKYPDGSSQTVPLNTYLNSFSSSPYTRTISLGLNINF